ncbi:MAG: methionyl-tRNA formyltransferase, partial [Candidatus Micrarchaeia archaeon]
MKVAALGRSEILYNTILKLKEAGHDVCLIITCKEAPDYSIGAEDFKLLAKKLNVPFLYTDQINSNEVINLIKNSGAEIGVSVNWRTLIGQEVIDCFRHGIINAHPGDLPRYRGNAVPNWAILNGEKEIVLTLHLMSVELDAGPIVLQRKMPISDRTYIGEVYDFINKNAPQMFVEVVKLFENNSVKIRLQPNNPALSLRC